jgi:hypothetical protein
MDRAGMDRSGLIVSVRSPWKSGPERAVKILGT